jgi:hypothetical protein
MKQTTITLADIRRALAAQDAQLAAAFAALDPKVPVAIPTASLGLLAEACSSAKSRPTLVSQIKWDSIRC